MSAESASPLFQQTVALAGIFQSAALVKQAAWHGGGESESRATLLHSLFKINAESVDDIYGGFQGLEQGLTLLQGHLGNAETVLRDVETARYTAQMLALQGKLLRDKQALAKIADGISAAELYLDEYGLQHNNIVARLAELYSSTISQLSPRIMVNGEPLHLHNTNTASMIRALLLAGVRSAVLWRQTGGTRLKLVFSRKKYLQCAEALLHKIASEPTAVPLT